jgi:hypothetical protein
MVFPFSLFGDWLGDAPGLLAVSPCYKDVR